MRLLHVENSSGRGGSLKSLSLLWPAPSYWEVEVVSLERQWSDGITCGVPVTVFDKQSVYKAWRFLQRGSFDVLHINNALIEAWSFVLAAWWQGIPVISHHRSVRPLRKIEYLLNFFCEKIFILSQAQKKMFPSYVKTQVLYNGIKDVGVVNMDDSCKIAMFSVLKEGKGHEDVIEALSRIESDWELLIVGGAVSDQKSTEDQLKKRVKEKGVESKVKFFGHVDNPQEIMKTCFLVVDPSHKAEGFRRTLCEAAMMACPVLATDVGGASDILEESELISPGNIDEWEKSLRHVLSDQKKTRARGKNLREIALNLFDIKKMHASFWRVANEVGIKRK